MSQPASTSVQAHPTEKNIDHLKLIKGNYQRVDFPITFKQEHGNKLYDILNTGYAGLFLISKKMTTVLKENNLTGWKVFSIKLYDKNDNEITRYHGFSIIGHSGPTSYEKSKIIEKRFVPNGPLCRYYKGVTLDNWDESDFFTPEGTSQTFITRKAADILKKNKISNMYLENLADAEINVKDVKPK